MSGLETNNKSSANTSNLPLIDQIMEQTRLKPNDDGYETAKAHLITARHGDTVREMRNMREMGE